MRAFRLFNKRRDALLAQADHNAIIHGNEVDGMPVEHRYVGPLLLPTGRIVVCDPLAYPDMPPFTRTVKPGNYPVTLHLARTTQLGTRIALAEVTFRPDRASRFELALRPGDDVSTLEEGGFFGFPVDAGLGAFMDLEAARHYAQFRAAFQAERPNGNLYDDLFAVEFARNATPGGRDGDWINHRFHGRPDLNTVMFSSGYGDGAYPAYWGLSRHGEVVSLIVDLHVLLLQED